MSENMAIEEYTIKNNVVKKYSVLGIILLIGLVFYVLNATKSGLWYDEAIEYFYSKFASGSVPGGFGKTNMYDRILTTYQPPLYNVLMFFWLSAFDSELAFRLAGILVTLVGAIGCFLAIEEYLHDSIWSYIGTTFYLFSSGVVYYALECAEYNLMLCFVAWTVYFFLRVINRSDWKSLVGFFVFACLSVYSQYGAAFIVVGMYASIFLFFLFEKKFSGLKKMLLASIITCIVAVVPLVVFFVYPQMIGQGSVAVSHQPYFQHNPVVAFIFGGRRTLITLFGEKTVYIVFILFLFSFFAVFVKTKVMIFPVISLAIAWTLYFVAVCCSFYGYNSWFPEYIGYMNLGGRYSLFFIPGIVVTLTLGMGIIAQWIKEKNTKGYNLLVICVVLGFVAFSITEIYRTSIKGMIKDDVREVASTWYELEGYKTKTLLHQWDDALFNFYLIHNDRYNKTYSDSIEAADIWIRTAEYDEMRDNLLTMGYLSIDDYYYITPNSGSCQDFISVVKDAGYSVEKVYDGYSLLLHLTK